MYSFPFASLETYLTSLIVFKLYKISSELDFSILSLFFSNILINKKIIKIKTISIKKKLNFLIHLRNIVFQNIMNMNYPNCFIFVVFIMNT